MILSGSIIKPWRLLSGSIIRVRGLLSGSIIKGWRLLSGWRVYSGGEYTHIYMYLSLKTKTKPIYARLFIASYLCGSLENSPSDML